MEKRPYIILTASSKGGVGKTLVAINVTAALRTAGYDVLLVDTDVANPSVGPLLGVRDSGVGYAEIVKGKQKPEETLVLYQPTGFYFIPAGSDESAIGATPDEMNKFYVQIAKSNFDFVIIDTPAGVNVGGNLKNFNEALIITTPEEPAVLGAQKLSKLYTKNLLLHKLVINRVKDDKYELNKGDIERMYGDVAYSLIPEDKVIEESEAKHTPAYLINKNSVFSVAIEDLCRSYALKAGDPNASSQSSNRGFNIKKFFGMK